MNCCETKGKMKKLLAIAIFATVPAWEQDASYQQCIAQVKRETQNPFLRRQYGFSSPDVQAQMLGVVCQRIELCKAIYCAEHPCPTHTPF